MKEKSITLIGTYSACNKGDAAMQLVAISEFSKKLDCNITVITPNENYDRDVYKNVRVIKSSRKSITGSTISLFRVFVWNVVYRIFKKDFKRILKTEELKFIYNSDLVVDLSGDMLTEDYGIKVAYTHLQPLYLVKLLKKPLFICAQSIGPFQKTRFFFHSILKYSKLITVRENISFNYLKNRYDSKKLIQTQDLGFLLDSIDKKEVAMLMSKENINLGKKFIGVTISQLIEIAYAKENKKNKYGFLDIIAKTIDNICELTDYNFLIVGHVTGPKEDKDDRIIGSRLLSKISHKNRAFLIKKDYNPQEVKGIIGLCDCFIGSRMHSNINALAQNIPTIAISYSHKTEGIMNEIGMSDFVIAIKDLTMEKLNEKIKSLIERKDELSLTIAEKVKRIKTISEKNCTLAIEKFFPKL